MVMKKWLTYLKAVWPFILALTGVLIMYFDCWSETFCPAIAHVWSGLFLYGVVAIAIGFISQLIILIVAFFRKWIRSYRVAALICLAGFILIWFLVPLKFDFFFLGGLSRVALAGGSEKLRKETLPLLNSSSTASISKEQWPESVKALGGDIRLLVNKEDRIIAIMLRPRNSMADEFGYIIQETPSDILPEAISDIVALWKVSDGVLFYQRP